MQWLAEHGRHQRPATEMRMDGEVDQRRLLVFVEKIEGIFVDLIKVSRAAPEGAVALRRSYPIPIRYRAKTPSTQRKVQFTLAPFAPLREIVVI
jgi:hypothetical protein